MAFTQKYGIKYPFTSENNDNVFMDVNDTYADSIKSKVMHVVLTQKGQKIMDPEFGTNLINYIFGSSDNMELSSLKNEVSTQLAKYVQNVTFKDLDVYRDENDDNNIIVSVTYTVSEGDEVNATTVAIKL